MVDREGDYWTVALALAGHAACCRPYPGMENRPGSEPALVAAVRHPSRHFGRDRFHRPDDHGEPGLPLLFVAATRARDALVISWHGQPSRFLPPSSATPCPSKSSS